ncbi:MAG TPA: histidine phosphatase family protein [Candidatus Paceibacterota bacterium]|nr:histidine phosphatase family protein [Candidatus Paceibacterota bacterium]
MHKRIYLIRHGQSEHNVTRTYLGRDSLLTDTGREQANVVAKRVKHLGVDVLIASDFPRALETASIIGERVGLPVESSELFREWAEASSLHSLHEDDERALEIIQRIFSNPDRHDHRHDDEETFTELATRANAALAFLEQHAAEKICVITHGAFLEVLVGTVLFRDEYTRRHFINIFNHSSSTNTGITYLEYRDNDGWVLRCWNDSAHLR